MNSLPGLDDHFPKGIRKVRGKHFSWKKLFHVIPSSLSLPLPAIFQGKLSVLVVTFVERKTEMGFFRSKKP